MTAEKNSFAWRAFTLVTTIVACVLVLNLLQKHDLIDKQAEGLLRLCINGSLGIVLMRATLRARIGYWLRVTILIVLVAAIAETVIDYTEDVPWMSEVPIVGRSSRVRRTLESVLAAGWMCGGVGVMFLSLRQVQNSRDESTRTINQLRESEQELQGANELLHATIQELKSTQEQLVRRERLSALGQMASGVAHDLNNALTPAAVFSELLLKKNDDLNGDQQDALESIRQSVLDAKSTLEGLQQFYTSGKTEQSPKTVMLGPLVRQVVSMTRPKWQQEPARLGKTIDVQLEIENDLAVRVDPAEIRAVLTNLVFNAVEAMPEGGTIGIRLFDDESEVVLSITDTGCGMSDRSLKHCFEPFYTTKSRGSGLGLSACYGIVERNGGVAEVESEVEGGTTFSLRFPAHIWSDDSGGRLHGEAEGDCECRILLIEDDERVLQATAMILRDRGAQVIPASGGAAGLRDFEERGPFDLVVTDLGMPDMDGRSVTDAIRQREPRQKVVVLSGWAPADVESRFADTMPPDLILGKPITDEDLVKLFALVEPAQTSRAL